MRNKKKVRRVSLPKFKKFRAKQFKSSAGQYRISPEDWDTIQVYEYGHFWTDTGRKLDDRIPK